MLFPFSKLKVNYISACHYTTMQVEISSFVQKVATLVSKTVYSCMSVIEALDLWFEDSVFHTEC